jgi:hypothetical protein
MRRKPLPGRTDPISTTPAPITPLIEAAAQAPTPLGLELLLGFVLYLVGGAVAVRFVFASSAVGIYLRYLRIIVGFCLAMAPVALVAGALSEPDQSAVVLSEACGLVIGTAWAGRRVHARIGFPKPAVPTGFRPFDYLVGVAIYLIWAAGLAAAAAEVPDTDLLSTTINHAGIFVVTQLTINVLFNVFNRALEDEYATNRGWHYRLAAFPVAASIAVDMIYRVAPTGAVFRLLLLAAAWRYTTQRPTSVWKTLKALALCFRPRPTAA